MKLNAYLKKQYLNQFPGLFKEPEGLTPQLEASSRDTA
jgi:hypothetical protein